MDSFSLNAKAPDIGTGRKPSEHDREISLIILTQLQDGIDAARLAIARV